MSQNIRDITAKEFDAEVLKSALPVVVDFWAPWCGPCMALAPILDDVANACGAVLKFVKVNIDNEPSLANLHGIKSIPTLILFRNGSEIERGIGGALGLEMIENFVKSLKQT